MLVKAVPMTKEQAQSIRQAKAERVRRIRRRVATGAVTLFVASWAVIAGEVAFAHNSTKTTRASATTSTSTTAATPAATTTTPTSATTTSASPPSAVTTSQS
jgi:hypothetical protein